MLTPICVDGQFSLPAAFVRQQRAQRPRHPHQVVLGPQHRPQILVCRRRLLAEGPGLPVVEPDARHLPAEGAAGDLTGGRRFGSAAGRRRGRWIVEVHRAMPDSQVKVDPSVQEILTR
jgi:hypothetical protein